MVGDGNPVVGEAVIFLQKAVPKTKIVFLGGISNHSQIPGFAHACMS